MPFSRFFGRGRDSAAQPQAPEVEPPGSDAEGDGPEPDEVDDASTEVASQRSWRERAEALLPTGASTGSKRAASLWGESADPELPTHMLSAAGCRVVDVDGETYI